VLAKEHAVNATSLIPAARYLRMSTDEQKLSLAYQAAAIQRYAEKHGFDIVSPYEDSGRSGLTLKRRKGLMQLLQDVISGRNTFEAVLVYDVSRWGRFQDTDESAYYEFLCKSAGVPVHYCAEPFKNNTSSPSVVMKTLKRIMAAEYSRELSERLTRTKKILTESGFRAGGAAGYGLRRMLLSPEGSRRRLLAHGEVKDIPTGRVILVPGPACEVKIVRDIFRLRVSKHESADAIAAYLNRKGITHPGVPWDGGHVREILGNPKYVGWATWRRTTGPLGTRSVKVPPNKWIAKVGAFEGIVDQETYDKAQDILKHLTIHKSNEELLAGLRALLLREGRISEHLIDGSPDLPSSLTYNKRFGGLRQAYALIGYREFRNIPAVQRTKLRLTTIRRSVFRQILRIFKNQVTAIQERGGSRQAMRFRDGVKISISICRCVDYGFGPRWVINVNRFERDYPALICRCTPDNKSLKDIHLVTRVDSASKTAFLTKEHDPWLRQGKQVRDLSRLRKILDRMLNLSQPAL
jgi:DNA invertase Pin-like site-specific DNA recombinase